MHALRSQLSLVACAGHPAGFADVVSHDADVDFALQKCSVEYGKPLRQYPFLQSASERHGEQKPPSPRQTPARGVQTRAHWHLAPAPPAPGPLQSPSDAHSGAHFPASQCCTIPASAGQSSSL